MMPSRKSTAFAKRGQAATGRIAELLPGRLCGVIRTRNGQTVFFHGRDLEDGGYNDLEVGLTVSFELIPDSVSGDRAARVKVVGVTKRTQRT